MQDWTQPEQERQPVANSPGGGQDAGAARINGMMSTLGKRTSERDEAIAERDRLRQQLAELTEQQQQPVEREQPAEPPASTTTAVAVDTTEDEDSDVESDDGYLDVELEGNMPEPDADGYIRTADGQVLASAMTSDGQLIAPTTPGRSSHAAQPREGSVEQLRQRFAEQLPGFVAELKDRIVLRGG
jgi:hypothetical protein